MGAGLDVRNTHYKAPATELLRALPLGPPLEVARCVYSEPEPTDHYMQVLMKPLKPGQAPRTKFLVKELLYVPRTVYRILTKTLSPIKGHDSNEEEVIGIMKNLLFNIFHGVPVNFHDFFMRTLANVAMSPFELKPYAPWIMRFIRTRSSLNYKADTLTIATTCPRLKSSNGHFPQLMKRARLLLLLMKAFVHWMVSFARLHLIPPMMTLPLRILLPMPPSQILKLLLLV